MEDELAMFMEATGCAEEEARAFMERSGSMDAATAVDAYFRGEEDDAATAAAVAAAEREEEEVRRGRIRRREEAEDVGFVEQMEMEDGSASASQRESTWVGRVFSRVKRVLGGEGGPSHNYGWLLELEDTLGLGHPAFHDGNFHHALSRANQEQRLLVVYLHSEHHELTDSFCRRTWYDPFIVDFFSPMDGDEGPSSAQGASPPPLLWAGDVRTKDGYQLFSSLKGTTFPLVACLMGSGSGGARLVRAIEGEIACDIVRLAQTLEGAAETVAAQLVSVRQERDEYQRARDIRAEQDEEYERALAEDIAREERKREEERAAIAEAEAEAARRAEVEARIRSRDERRASRELELSTRRASACDVLPPEPATGSAGVTTIRINLPNGKRELRKFGADATLRNVFDWVTSLDDCTFLQFNLVSNFPRVVFTREMHEGETLAACGLSPQSALFIEVEDDVEEEEMLDEGLDAAAELVSNAE